MFLPRSSKYQNVIKVDHYKHSQEWMKNIINQPHEWHYQAFKETKLGLECSFLGLYCVHLHLVLARGQIHLFEEDNPL